MAEYEYDENLPFVVSARGYMYARFRYKDDAEEWSKSDECPLADPKVIDTTPKPRVPEGARFITWLAYGSYRWFAERAPEGGWWMSGEESSVPLEDLPGVTDETVFTALDERRES